MEETFKKELVACVEKAVETENFSEVSVNLTRPNEKGEGSLAEIIFATVTGTDKDNKHKELYLAVKFGKRDKELRESLPVMTDCYKREIFVYSKVLPTFHKFELEKNLASSFSVVPKCYGTFLSENIEALIFEDLKNKGFKMHNKKLSMNLQHTQLVLKSYAEFHARSLALRDQDKEKFNGLTADYKSIMRNLILTMGVVKNDDTVQSRLRQFGREDLAAKYEKEVENGKENILLGVLDDIPDKSVIIHGDCHNNNFLFQYKDDDKENPINMSILDWQLSEIHSPVIDLSFFLYCSGSKTDLSKLDKLLKFYHVHLTDFMKKLGSDSTKVFSYSTLVEHWNKYSIYAFIFASSVLQNFYVENEDTLPTDGITKQGDLNRMMENVRINLDDSYKDRLISLVEHYFSFVLT